MKIKESIENKLKDLFKTDKFHIIAIVITGSHAYGMNTKDSDIDILGIFLPPEEYILGVKRVEQVSLLKHELGFEGTMFSFSKWYNLMVQQNPNVQELLWSADNMYIYKDNLYFNWLLESRKYLLSKKLKHSYGGYAHAQIQRLKALNEKVNQNKKRLEEFEKFGYSTKNASHVFRLLNMCLDALVEHEIQVLRPENQFLIAIREGQYTYEQIREMSDKKFDLIERAYVASELRNKVDDKFEKDLHLKILKNWLNKVWTDENNL